MYIHIFAASTPLGKDTGLYESLGCFIIALLDKSVTTTLYICVLFINNPIRESLYTLHCHVL